MCECSSDTYVTTTGCRIQISAAVFSCVSISKVRAIADKHGLSVHMDGARVMNAAVAQGVHPSTIMQHTHTVSVCLSKVGLQNTRKRMDQSILSVISLGILGVIFASEQR